MRGNGPATVEERAQCGGMNVRARGDLEVWDVSPRNFSAELGCEFVLLVKNQTATPFSEVAVRPLQASRESEDRRPATLTRCCDSSLVDRDP